MRSYFIWKNINSLDKNIIINKMPDFERATSNIEKITIPGRDGFITQDDGTFQSVLKECECSLDDWDISDICSWLTGTSELILSDEPDKKYKATIINNIKFSKIIPVFHEFLIQFDCQPYKYAVENEHIEITENNYEIHSKTNVVSNPIIKVFGTGDITLDINSNKVILKNIDDYVVIDSENMNCYKDTVLKNSNMYGDFPVLNPGINIISWVGNITKIELTPNWRWL